VIGYGILVSVLAVAIYGACLVLNLPVDPDDPAEGASGICPVSEWQGNVPVYNCSPEQRTQALEAVRATFNTEAPLISLTAAIVLSILIIERNKEVDGVIAHARSLPSDQDKQRQSRSRRQRDPNVIRTSRHLRVCSADDFYVDEP
jgi:hypothetical protein